MKQNKKIHGNVVEGSITRENTQVVGIQERLETANGVENSPQRQEPFVYLEKDINIQVL